jgi:hypothetical protein
MDFFLAVLRKPLSTSACSHACTKTNFHEYSLSTSTYFFYLTFPAADEPAKTVEAAAG